MVAGGSSPLARGLRHEKELIPLVRRIIPARAGFTVVYSSPIGQHSDHPRSRGVYMIRDGASARSIGSSPLARGLRIDVRYLERALRIIPARAGFTGHMSPISIVRLDHPRSRGVHAFFSVGVACGLGSSPLARGLRHVVTVRPDGVRIIPARAGFKSRGDGEAGRRQDHPRSRGV